MEPSSSIRQAAELDKRIVCLLTALPLICTRQGCLTHSNAHTPTSLQCYPPAFSNLEPTSPMTTGNFLVTPL